VFASGGGTDAPRQKSELFYRAADRNLMAVPYRATPKTFEPGAAKSVASRSGERRTSQPAVTSDGHRSLSMESRWMKALVSR
jgi:hypothetical protein